MKVRYCQFQLQKLAELIFQYNQSLLTVWSLTTVDDVKEFFLDHAFSHVPVNLDVMAGKRPQDEWISWSSTGGCTVVYSGDGNDTLEFDFTFCPGVMPPNSYDPIDVQMEDV